MDETSLDLAIGALERFAAFVETLTPDELAAVAALAGSDEDDVEGFGVRWGAASAAAAPEGSFEYIIGLSGNLARSDHASSLAMMRNQLEGLKAAKGSSRSFRWPP